LKDALTALPILAYPDFKSSEPFILDSYWSLDNNAVGACLSQRQSGQERVICYGAKKLSKLQANYPSTKGELAAIIIFIQKWRYFLRHRPFCLRLDNSALQWIHSMEAPTGMIKRWLNILANHQFVVEHRAGIKKKSRTPPAILVDQAVHRAHHEAAHMGVAATTLKVLKFFYFPAIAKHVEELILAWGQCQRRDNKEKDQRHTLHSHQEGFPFQKLTLDFVGPLLKSSRGN
jgi:hypothetical protein